MTYFHKMLESVHPHLKQYMLEKYVPAKLPDSTLEVIFLDSSSAEDKSSSDGTTHGQQRCIQLGYPFARSPITALPIKAAHPNVVTADVETQTKRVLELTLDTTATCFDDFQPGDTIGILPTNSATDVQHVLCALQLNDATQWDSSCRVGVLPASCGSITKKAAKLPPAHIPNPTTPRELLRDCLNLRAPLKKQFLRALSDCCAAAEERDFLCCLSAKEASAQYNALVLERGFNLLELLQVCGTCRPTLALLVEHLPRLLPRPYSIANSPLACANEIRIIFSVQTPPKTGVTTQMLEQLASSLDRDTEAAPPPPPARVLAYLRDANKFRYTAADLASNQILIAIGTGLSPFLGFLEHKQHLAKAKESCTSLGQTWLFAGAATAASLLHRERLLQWQRLDVLQLRYFESLSRVADARFAYVQELLSAHAREFVEFLLLPQTVLYICADGAQISKSIETAICACLVEVLALPASSDEATQMLKQWRASGKYREDLWV